MAQTGKTAKTYNGLVDSEGNPLSDKVVFAKHEEPAPIGFVLKGNKQGTRGRPPLTPEKVAEIQAYLQNGFSIRKTAEACEVSVYSVTEIKKQAKTL